MSWLKQYKKLRNDYKNAEKQVAHAQSVSHQKQEKMHESFLKQKQLFQKRAKGI